MEIPNVSLRVLQKYKYAHLIINRFDQMVCASRNPYLNSHNLYTRMKNYLQNDTCKWHFLHPNVKCSSIVSSSFIFLKFLHSI